MLELWYQALSVQIGIVVETNNVERFRAQLYAARREAHDPGLEALSLVISPTTPGQIWIIKNRNGV